MNPLWIDAVVGGAMIGAAAAALLLVNGRIAGVSGILGNAIRGANGVWRYAFLLGLIAAPLWTPLLGLPYAIAHHRADLAMIAVAGVLVGLGTRIGSGCTSGHGVCGIANFSLRSLAATIVFIATAMLTVLIVHHLLGGGL
jgi:uncharacterized membrane protein YedE/YeeE